jgi:hypothetical protein
MEKLRGCCGNAANAKLASREAKLSIRDILESARRKENGESGGRLVSREAFSSQLMV